MRFVLAALLLASFACSKEPKKEILPASDGAIAAEFIPGHVVAKTKNGAPLEGALARRFALVKERDLGGGAALYRIEGLDPAGADARARTLDAVDALRKDPSVAWAEVDAVMTALPRD